jgi:UDP-2-acetamido-3-amino-2,3-dideoxy-glucuronate N-acetyltransferase
LAESPFIHELALVESNSIGSGARIWAFAHVTPGAVIGADCIVYDQTYVEDDAVVGDRVTIKSGVFLWNGLRVEDDVFIGPQATFTNDLFRAAASRSTARSRPSVAAPRSAPAR